MPQDPVNITAVRQVTLAVSRLESLSTLPSVAARLLSNLPQNQTLPPGLIEIVESDPALTARILSLAAEQGITSAGNRGSLRQIISKLPVEVVRQAVLSVNIVGLEQDDDDRVLLITQMSLHCLAVGCCAKEIAEAMTAKINSQLAYTAGLLHDIGKLAIDAAMPKSFVKIVEEAKSQNLSSCDVERKHLGVDHTILGKRLAAKWQLPDEIALAIWLHHSDTEAIAQNTPAAGIAQIVQLADGIARQCGIGQSGSYDVVESQQSNAASLGITAEQLEQSRQKLGGMVEQKAKVLGFDLPRPTAAYCDAARKVSVKLSAEQAKLSLENHLQQAALSHFDFIKEFLLSINSTSTPITAAESFAVGWQKFYQTGPVCLYLASATGEQTEAVVVESLGQSETVYLNAPTEAAVIPEAMQNKFAILNAYDRTGWLFEQLDVDFNPSYTKIVPLLCGNRAVGALAFELRYPGDMELFLENFKTVTSIAGAVLAIIIAEAGQQNFAELFAKLARRADRAQPRTEPQAPAKEPPPVSSADNLLTALAEMAGGAAHELNNPLSVIYGRAQLLAGSESDAEKKRLLVQIQKNAREMAGIIEGLMAFAKPPKPRPQKADIKHILAEAVELTAMKINTAQPDVKIDTADNVPQVSVDSAQIVSAIANILANALESYPANTGQVNVTASEVDSDFIRVQISDNGCGMDAVTLKKATQPFFSAKPAGRKQGMGLSHAQRLIQLNGGSLEITSKPASGTTVTILLRTA